ncbi:MAG: nucleoside-diphosphate kinase [Candidatus Neomarinimicrobiota bacterium]
MKERSLAIVKPDAVRKGLAGKIIDRISSAGFTIVAMEQVYLTRNQAEGFYAVHKDKEFFKDLVEFMTSGPCIPMVVKKRNAIRGLRDLMGDTDPAKARMGTIRNEFGSSIQENVIHGSDSNETALKEIAFFFSAIEIPNR